jgi:hypothetical protein
VGEVPEIVTSNSTGHSRAVSPIGISVSPSVGSESSPNTDFLPGSSQASLVASQYQTKAARRRSFLPIDVPLTVSTLPALIPPTVPEASLIEEESSEPQSDLLESERLARAKRTLFAYLQDMMDLNALAAHSQFPNIAPSTVSPSEHWVTDGTRSRRATVSENGPARLTSESSFSTGSSGPGTPSTPLNSMGSSFGARESESGTNSARTSMFTTDSDPPVEERKIKDDKNKRARVIREIVEYVFFSEALLIISDGNW